MIALAAVTMLAAPAGAAEFRIGPDTGMNLVVFESSAPMETFDGRTDRATGTVHLDGDDAGTLQLTVTVDLTSLDTGIGLRNRHMRENHLHTDRFPNAVFTSTQVLSGADAALAGGAPVQLTVEGTLDLHGVTRTIQVPVTLTRSNGDDGARLHVEGRFDVALADHEIPRPKMLMLKLDEIQKVRVDLHAVAMPGGAEAEAADDGNS
jgi:polyisoprenoid-binding protein YceI